MKKARTLITANWKNLVSANYIVNPKLLQKHLPFGTELDYFNGNCYVSLVAFKYTQTQLNKISIPFHSEFEEVNLRIYVKKKIAPNKYQYGVAFPKLFFPKKALTLYAKLVYKEDYSTLKMKYLHETMENNFFLKYSIKNHIWHDIKIIAEKTPSIPLIGSSDEYFNKHFWGYSRVNDSTSTEYELIRDEWSVHKINEWDIKVDFKSLFGDDFDFLKHLKPESITLSNGSKVEINSPGRIIRNK